MSLAKRDEFLIAFYNNMWLNVRRAETSLWVLFPFYFTSLIGLLFSREQIGIFLVLFLILMSSIFFSIITFNLNLWFIRNMRLVAKAERDFFDPKKDYNKIIPEKWITQTIPFLNKEPYCLLGIGYILVGILTTFFYIYYFNGGLLSNDQLAILFFLWGISLLIELLFVNNLKKRYYQNVKDTP